MTANAQLQSFIDRIERLTSEKEAIAADIKEVKAEAKSAGFDVPTINRLLKLRKLSDQERREQQELLEAYEASLGALKDTPLGDAAIKAATDPGVQKAVKRFVDTVAKNPGDSVSIVTAEGATTVANVDGKKVVSRTESPPGTKTVAGAVDALKQRLAGA